MDISDLYKIADENKIAIYFFPLHPLKSVSLPGNIGIDSQGAVNTNAEEKSILAHEIGHCMKGAFYNYSCKYNTKSRCEYKADKWAIQNTIPFNELEAALKSGNTEVWSLAEYFGVTYEFMNKALELYENKLIELRTKFEYM